MYRITLAILRLLGNIPVEKERLIILESGLDISDLSAERISAGIL